jgi:hypothetical protein
VNHPPGDGSSGGARPILGELFLPGGPDAAGALPGESRGGT